VKLLPTLDELQTAGSYIGLRLIGSNKEMASYSYVCEVQQYSFRILNMSCLDYVCWSLLFILLTGLAVSYTFLFVLISCIV
jgi:hypothetical protein